MILVIDLLETNDYAKDKKKEKTSNAFETNTNKILYLKTEYV